jgi:hypothetical protein
MRVLVPVGVSVKYNHVETNEKADGMRTPTGRVNQNCSIVKASSSRHFLTAPRDLPDNPHQQ